MKTNILFLVLLLTGTVSYAQQDAQFTQYMYNTIVINPAYAGSRGAMSIFGLYRTQWVGLDGAPTTGTFSINTPIENSGFGFGLSVANDQVGPTNETDLSADISYTIRTSETYKLSFGVKATANAFDLDTAKLDPAQPGDPQFHDLSNVISPNAGAGVYLHSD